MLKLIEASQISVEFKYWFSKTIYDNTINDFNDFEIFDKALNIFQFDYLRYFINDNEMEIGKIKMRLELVGILMYRVAREFYLINDIKCEYYSLLGRLLSGFEIYYSAEIGKGLKINHGLGTIIGSRVKIGENCLLHQNITLGDKNNGRPTIGDNVIIYSGAKILGEISIGHGTVIGANTLCMKDAPENSILVGIPAKNLK